MTLETISTGSIGNCYLLRDCNGNTLILDAGVKRKEIIEALGYSIEKVNGVLITHSHKDHSLSADELKLFGLDVFSPYKTESGRDKRALGKYSVTSFDVPHGDCPCCGFYIKHIDGFKMLYLTDLEYCQYRFTSQGINFILCECNWDKQYVSKDARNYRHKVLDHMSLDACIDLLKANKTAALQAAAICHMSNQTLDVSEAIERIKEEVGIENVYAAEKNKTIYL